MHAQGKKFASVKNSVNPIITGQRGALSSRNSNNRGDEAFERARRKWSLAGKIVIKKQQESIDRLNDALSDSDSEDDNENLKEMFKTQTKRRVVERKRSVFRVFILYWHENRLEREK